MTDEPRYAFKYSPAADADTLRMHLLNGLQKLGLDKTYPNMASLDKDPLGMELARAVVAWKTEQNASMKGSPPMKVDDLNVNWATVLELQKYASAKKAMMDSVKTAGLVGLGLVAVVGMGAYYMGKRSRSFAELTVGSYDSRISLPMYT